MSSFVLDGEVADVDVSSAEYRPLPPISHGTVKRNQGGVSLRAEIDAITRPIFEEEFHRKQKKSELDSYGYQKKGFKILWRPNNYRRKISYLYTQDSGFEKALTHYPGAYVTEKNVLFVPDYPGILLMVGKKTITGIWSQRIIKGVPETFCLERGSLGEIESLIELKKNDIGNKIDAAILHFVGAMSWQVNVGAIAWERSENWFRGDAFVDRLPREAVFYDSVVKKVYGGGLEFVSGSKKENSVVSMIDYLHNQQVQSVSPEIGSRLANIERSQILILDSLSKLQKDSVRRKVEPVVRSSVQFDLSRWFV